MVIKPGSKTDDLLLSRVPEEAFWVKPTATKGESDVKCWVFSLQTLLQSKTTKQKAELPKECHVSSGMVCGNTLG